MLILVFFTINLVYQVNCENSGNVRPLDIYHITFNENECFVSKNSTIIHQRKESLGTARFVHKGPLNCAWQDDVNLKVEDENVGSNFRKEYIEDPKNLKQRICTYLPEIVNCTFNFVLKEPTGIKWKKETPPKPGPKDNEKETPPEKDPKDGGNPDLYKYVGAGVGLIILIVIIQTAYIIRYRRKVANSRRALNTVLMTRKEKSNHEDRYSTGPFRKLKSTKINAEGDENIYESLDNLPDAVKGSTDTMARNIRARLQMALPPELQLSQGDVRTFPQKNASQENLTERFEQPNHSTVPRRRPNIHANRPVIHELNQVLLKKQYHLSSTSISRQPLNLEPRGQSPNQVPLSNRPPPPPHHQSSSNISRYALKPESPKKPNHEPRSYRPPPPHHLSTPSTPRQALSRKMSKVPPNPPQKPRKPEPHPPPPVSRRSHDSSDEEWTQYDILPPIENYLR